MKITNVKWESVTAITARMIIEKGDAACVVCLAPEGYPNSIKKWDERARIIAEAGTVANQTGKTPQQLADENKELLVALSGFLNNQIQWMGSAKTLRKAEKAIQKAIS